MIEIEKDLPIPPIGNAKTKYPYMKMEIGDSFFVSKDVSPPTNVISSAKGYWHLKSGFRFACRQIDDGVRVWRVE